MGVVYQAVDLAGGARRSRSRCCRRALGDDLVALLRFKREARTASSLSHPAICRIFDIGDHRGRPFIVMELLEGETVKERLGRGHCDTAPGPRHRRAGDRRPAAPRTASSSCTATSSRPTSSSPTSDASRSSTSGSRNTSRGSIRTARSPSPTEAHAGHGRLHVARATARPAPRSAQRLYSLGVLLYEVLCGRRRSRRATTAEKMAAILHSGPPPLPAMPHRRGMGAT